MGDTPAVFLTDERRAVLEGNYDGADNTRRTHQSRIRSRSATAIEELTEVAESPHIDNTDVFDPDDVFHLLRALFQPDPSHQQSDEFGGIVQREDFTDDYRAYQDSLYVQLNKLLLGYHKESSD